MGKIMLYVSDAIIPGVFFVVIFAAVYKKTDIFGDFINGVKEGFDVTLGILPTLIGLMTAVGILRASGGLDIIGNVLAPAAELLKLPKELVPLITVKMFSSSAAVRTAFRYI